MQKLRINMEQNTSSKLDTSTEPTSNTPSVASRPTESELDLELADLVHWQRFATHLPDIRRTDIEEIEKNRLDIADQKLALFGTWLRKSFDATWNHVIQALEKAQEKRLSESLRKVCYSSISL